MKTFFKDFKTSLRSLQTSLQKRFRIYSVIFLAVVFLSVYVIVWINRDAKEWSEVASQYYYRGKLEKAIEIQSRAIKLEPKNPFFYSKRADFFFWLGEHEQAVRDYNVTLKLMPVSFTYRSVKEAKEEYDKLESFAVVYIKRGKARFKLGHYKEAVKDFNRALLLKAEPMGIFGQEETKTVLEMELGASKEIKRLAVFERGLVYEKLGDIEKARSDFETAAKLDSEMARERLEKIGVKQPE